MKLYRFPVMFAFDDWLRNVPNQMAAYTTTRRQYFSEYGRDGKRYCKTYAPVERDRARATCAPVLRRPTRGSSPRRRHTRRHLRPARLSAVPGPKVQSDRRTSCSRCPISKGWV